MTFLQAPNFAKMKRFGLWRSLVARLLGVQEVVSSNLASPTIPHRYNVPDPGFF